MSTSGPGGGAVRDAKGQFAGKKEDGDGREIALHQEVLTGEQKEELRAAEVARLERLEELE
jgi:hypothetical protein